MFNPLRKMAPSKGGKTTAPNSCEGADEPREKTSTFMDEHWPNFEHEELDSVMTLDLLSKKPLPALDYLIEGFVQRASVVIVRSDPDVDCAWYLNVLATYASAGGTLPPYGPIEPIKTCIVHSGNLPRRAREQLKLAYDTLPNPERWKRAKANLFLAKMADHERRNRYLTIASDQQRLVGSVPDGTQLVVIPDACLPAPMSTEKNEMRNISWIFRKFGEKEAAVILHVEMDRREWAKERKLLRIDCPFNLVEFVCDPAVPREFGSGFIVHCSRISEFDTGPLRYRVSYIVKDGKMHLGFDLLDSPDALSPKQWAIAERQAREQELLAKGMSRRSIAEDVGVHPATVTRDLNALAKAQRKSQKKHVLDDDVTED